MQKYMNSFIESMPESDSVDTENFCRLLKNTDKIRKLVFGRKDLNSESFYEKFWSVNLDDKDADNERSKDEIYKDGKFLKCAYHIWNEFRLWEKPEILTIVS
jgi:hypothetical protein